MLVEKEIEILNSKWKLTYCTFTKVFGFKRRLMLYMIEMTEHPRSIRLYNYDKYYYLHFNHEITPYMFETVMEAKIKIITFLLNHDYRKENLYIG